MNPNKRTHGHTWRGGATKTYHAWNGMRARCTIEGNKDYPNWGGRGITICPSWDAFEKFLADMGEAPPGRSLGRRDNNLGYSKDNCRWETRPQQDQNRRDNHNLTLDGSTFCIAEWARRIGIRQRTLLERLRNGWSVERTLTTPARKYPTARK